MTPAAPHTQHTQALEQLRLANLNRAASTQAYRDALLTAHRSGATYAEIGAALGITRQSARTAVQNAQ